jgi:hypothetical protein
VALMRDTLSLSAYLIGLTLFFVAERIVGSGSVAHLPLASLAVLLILGSFIALVARWRRASGESRAILGRLIPAYTAGLLAVAVYGLTTKASPFAVSDDHAGMLTVLALVIGSAGTCALVLMEISLVSMVGAPHLEGRRIREAGKAGAGLAFALCLVGLVNFLGNEHNERIDMRTVRNLDPSGATVEMVRNLSEPITVTLAFPPANEVGDAVASYFEILDDVSELFTVQRMDRDMEPVRSKELRIRKNGTVVVSAGDEHKSLPLGVDAGKARSKLKKLDADFQKRLSKVSGGQKIAYFVSDHGERSTSPKPQDPGGLKTAKKVLEQLGYKVKRLGMKEGLGDDVPDDARLLFVVGPEHPLSVSERDSIDRYVRSGGGLFLLVDPDTEQDIDLGPLLAPFGLGSEPGVLAHERYNMRFEGGVTDRGFIFTNSYGSHPSTALLSKKRSQVYVVARNAGRLVKLAATEGGPDVTVTLKAMPKTWADLDGDFEYSAKTEQRGTFPFAAAVQFPANEDEGTEGGRAIVAYDADILGDLPMTRQGNLQWFYDSIRWVEDEIQLAGEVADIEDVRILHSEGDDALWFWSSTAGIPMLVLGVGALNARRRRRRP